ncbi:hypothetical protein HK101_000713 [Irineochytrium annulatum]|nr:hypothetical protein HK101_000713 [Irineochytrium annulatum]
MTATPADERPGTILICRNKHFPYIASYHGPWLSLPVEIFSSLVEINAATKPSPVDVTVFRNLLEVRKLVDEASDLVIKAVSGPAAGGPQTYHHHNSVNDLFASQFGGGGVHRANIGKVSHIRQQRLREMAVARLAKAYRIDEIATSVLTMQSASALDDVAMRVLKRNPNNLDALYVHFFHEKIPSRMLAQSTTTAALDRLIESSPGVPEYYRTRAMAHGFREEFPLALRDFKTAIALTQRRRQQHASSEEGQGCESQLYFLRAACTHQYAVHLMEKPIQKINELFARPPPAAAAGGATLATTPPPTATKTASVALTTTTKTGTPPDHLRAPFDLYRPGLEKNADQIKALARKSIRDYCHFLSFYPNGLPAFLHPVGSDSTTPPPGSPPLSPSSLTDDGKVESLSEFISALPSKADLSSLIPTSASKAVVPRSAGATTPTPSPFKSSDPRFQHSQPPPQPQCGTGCLHCSGLVGAYHPLLVEAWYLIGINYMILGEWATAIRWHERVLQMQNLNDGYPFFLPARSMGQSDFTEIVQNLRRVYQPQAPQLPPPIKQGKLLMLAIKEKGEEDGDGAGAGQQVVPIGGEKAAVRRSASSPSVKKKALGDGKDGGKGKTPGSKYNLHTKRVDTVLVWLQREVLGAGKTAAA